MKKYLIEYIVELLRTETDLLGYSSIIKPYQFLNESQQQIILVYLLDHLIKKIGGALHETTVVVITQSHDLQYAKNVAYDIAFFDGDVSKPRNYFDKTVAEPLELATIGAGSCRISSIILDRIVNEGSLEGGIFQYSIYFKVTF